MCVIYGIQKGQKSLIFLKKLFELCARNIRTPRNKKTIKVSVNKEDHYGARES
jgi:hypothetical protein